MIMTQSVKQEMPEGYKQTEIGVIPEDWDVRKIIEFTDCTAGGTPSTFTPAYWGGNIKWMNSGELNNKKIFNVAGRITTEGLRNSSTKIVPANCVLIGLAGQGKTRGTAAINRVELCTNQSIAAIYPTEHHNSDYLYYSLDSRYDELRSLSTGGEGRGGLNLSIIRNILVTFPQKHEQDRIAASLSDIDLLVEKLEELVKKKKNIKQGAMQELLTGKRRLLGFGVKDGLKRTEIGMIPTDWSIKTCEELGSFYKGRGISSKDLVQDGLPCIMYGDIYVKFETKFVNPDFRITKNTAAKSSRAKKGDLFFTSSGETAEEIGKCVVYLGDDDIYIGGDIIALAPNKCVDSLFLAYMQNSKVLLSQKANLGQGYTVVHIYTEHIKSLKIPFPSTKREQTAIANILSDMDSEIEELESQLQKYKNIKQGMMQNLLTGKIRLIKK